MLSRLRTVSAVAVALAIAAGPALAAAPKKSSPKAEPKPVCYSRAEHAAEQFIRLHTEMMTVGLYCKELAAKDDPYGMYQRFTIDHRSDLAAAEKVLIDFYARNGGRAKFDTFRTELANELSRRSAFINVGIYCHEFVDRVKDTLALSVEQLKTLTNDEAKGGLMYLASRPLCETKVVTLPDPPPPPPAAPAPAKGKTPAKPAGKPPAKAPAKPVKTAAAQ
jgi:hypothetical protein